MEENEHRLLAIDPGILQHVPGGANLRHQSRLACAMRAAAYLVLLATLLLWSGNWIVARAVRDEIAPGIATAGRLLIVLLILVPFVFQGLKTKLGKIQQQGWQTLLALGFFGGGLHLALQWLGLHYTTATSAVLYLSTSPVFI
ncbi:MAG: EamA family transporter, partial [Terriglobales bacterium]